MNRFSNRVLRFYFLRFILNQGYLSTRSVIMVYQKYPLTYFLDLHRWMCSAHMKGEPKFDDPMDRPWET
ncbi:MAG: hypothetical protein CL941_04850 [Desulfobacter sp.]|nr:hypothetical protein [Desulfobacter sp.]